jgi:hypothetical protein
MAHENQIRVLIGSCILMCALLCTAGEDTWIEVRSPNFTVISDASIKKARQVAKRLEQFRSVFHTAFPKLRMDPGSPLIVYAARNEGSVNACRILIEMERYDEACRLAERILALAQTEAERQQAESLLFAAKGRQRASLEANRRTEVLPERELMTEEMRHSAGGFNKKRQTETTASMQPAERSASENRTGGTGKLKGLVRSVKCENPAIMDVVLESVGNEYTLRAENYYHVQYRAVGAPAKT